MSSGGDIQADAEFAVGGFGVFHIPRECRTFREQDFHGIEDGWLRCPAMICWSV